MYISRFEIRNYKSYFRSNPVELKPGFNVVTGQNNAGKTAFLEALSLRLAVDPHRSLKTVPNPGDRLDPSSSVDISFVVSRQEFIQIVAVPDAVYYIPAPALGTEEARAMGYLEDSADSQRKFVDWLLARDSLPIRVCRVRTPNEEKWTVPGLSLFGLYPARNEYQPGMRYFVQVRYTGDAFLPIGVVGMDERNDIGIVIANVLMGRIYRFAAERFKVAIRGTGTSATLNFDASGGPKRSAGPESPQIRRAKRPLEKDLPSNIRSVGPANPR